MPVALPTMPCAKLKRPVPREMSASGKRHEDAQHGAGNAVEHLHGHDHAGIAGAGEQGPAQRQRRRSPAAAPAAGPRSGRAVRRAARSAATTSWVRRCRPPRARWPNGLDRVVISLPTSGSMAAFATWKSRTQAARMSSAGLRRAGRCWRCALARALGADAAIGPHRIDLALANRATGRASVGIASTAVTKNTACGDMK